MTISLTKDKSSVRIVYRTERVKALGMILGENKRAGGAQGRKLGEVAQQCERCVTEPKGSAFTFYDTRKTFSKG